jgi:hypothetical protein
MTSNITLKKSQMKKYFTCLACLFPFVMNAQLATIEWGPEHVLDRKYRGKARTAFIEANEDHYYMLAGIHDNEQKTFTYSYDQSIEKEQIVELTFEGKSLPLTDILNFTEHTFGVSYQITSGNKLQLILSDFDQGNFSNPRKVYEHTYKKQGVILDQASWRDAPQSDAIAQFFYSADRSKVLFVNQTKDDGNEGNDDEFQIAVFNDQMELLWEKTIFIPMQDEKFIAEAFVLSNSGKDVFFVGKLHTYLAKHESDFKVFQVSEDQMVDYEFQLSSKETIRSMALYLEEADQRLVIGGLYELKGTNVIEGIFSATFDVLRKTYSSAKLYPLNKPVDRTGSNYFAPSSLFRRPSGYFQLIATAVYGPPFARTLPNEPNLITTMNTRDIILGSFHPDKDDGQAMMVDRPQQFHFHKNKWAFWQQGDESFLIVDAFINNSYKEQFNIKGGALHQFILFLEFDQNGMVRDQKALTSSKATKQVVKELYAFKKEDTVYVGGTFESFAIGPGVPKRFMKFFSFQPD